MSEPAKAQSPSDVPANEQRTAISEALVAIHREQFGRGPERARTIMSGDLIACVLEGVLTPSEESLIAGGSSARVADSRWLLQRDAEARFVAAVERITGRQVKEFISGMNPHADGTAVEVFVLASRGTASAQLPE
jgi:uncharacterized protein YbcI